MTTMAQTAFLDHVFPNARLLRVCAAITELLVTEKIRSEDYEEVYNLPNG
jgi:hypothetical protein